MQRAHKVQPVPDDQDTRERLNAAGLEVDYRKTEEFGGYLKDQRARFADIIRKNNIRIE